MAESGDVRVRRPKQDEVGDRRGEWERAPQAPRWILWTPAAALLWGIVYGALRTWWAITGAPSFVPSSDLLVFTGWWAVGLCAVAAGVALAVTRAPWARWLLVGGWAVSAALLMSAAMLLLDVVGGLFPGLGVTFHPAAFANRAAALLGGILVGASVEAYRRRWRSACLFCGRSASSAPNQLPGWAKWAAYAAVAGWLVRLGTQVVVGFGGSLLSTGLVVLAFEAVFVLAGTVLPMALIRPWGRVVPRWVPILAGRQVPRWLLLIPGLGVGGGMTAYFGFTLVKVVADTFGGTWDESGTTLPLAFFWVAVPAYLVWGLGLGAAAIAYYKVTRPTCRVCGR